MPKHWNHILFALLGLAIVCSLSPTQLRAQTSPSLEKRLQQRISVTWQGQEIGSIIRRLMDTQGISIWLDRRVDPQQEINLHLQEASLHEALKALANEHNLGISLLKTVVYLGPPASSRDLATLSELASQSLKKTSGETKKHLEKKEHAYWPKLSQPQMLLQKIALDAGFQIANINQIPMDLWPEKELPDLSRLDQMTLLLVGFDLTCQFSADGKTCELVPIRYPASLEQTYQLPKNNRTSFDKLQQAITEGQFTREGRSFTYTGRWEDHLKIQALLKSRTPVKRQAKTRPPRKKEKQFSLQLTNQPVGAVIEQLAKQLSLEVTWDENSLAAAGIRRDTPVSCRVKNAGIDKLLESILSPAGLASQREGNRLKISAKN